jgi:curved DNA-binding protein CbpA
LVEEAMTTLYQVLGVSPGASLIEIRDAYWEAARILHPDANPGNDTTDVFTDLANA